MSKLNLLFNNLKLTQTQNLILDSVKKFSRLDLLKSANSDFKNKRPREIYQKFGNMGILGPTISNYGCLGESYKMYGLIAKELEYVDSGYRSMYSVQSSLVMNPINKFGTNYAKHKYLEGLAKGELIGCFGLTEADTGSDASAMKTNATLEKDEYILNGSKTWITNSPIADVFIIWAKYEDSIAGFVLDKNMKGISTPEIKSKMSLNTSATGMIFLDNVKVPLENKLDVTGMKGPLTCLNDARLGISFGVLGSAEYCIETALDYSKNRYLFGSLLAEKQLFQSKLADMVSEYNLAMNASLTTAEYLDNGDGNHEMISLVKRNNCKKSLDIVRTCRDILGGNGIVEDYNIFRHLVNLETVNTYEGTFDIHSLILGNYLTGYKAF